jgi:hypothetical protein
VTIGAPWIGTSVSGSGGGTSVIMDISGATDGEWAFVAIIIADSQSSPPTAPSGWALTGAPGQEGPSGGASSCLTVYQRIKQTGDTTFTFTWPTTRKFEAIVWSWPGLNKVTPTEGYAYNPHSVSGTSYVSSTLTPTDSNRWAAMVSGARGTTANQTWTPDGALTERIDANHGGTTPFTAIELADSNAPVTTAPATYTATDSQSDPNGGVIVFALIPDVGGGAAPQFIPPPLLYQLALANQEMWQQPAHGNADQGGTVALGLSGSGTAVHVAGQGGTSALGLSGTAADRKTAPDTGRSVLGLSGSVAGGKTAPDTGRSVLGLAGGGSIGAPPPGPSGFTASDSRWARTLTTLGPDPTFDLDTCVGQRQATFQFHLVNALTGQVLGQLFPIMDTAPTLTHDTTRTTKRGLALLLDVADTAAINTLTDRVTVSMLIAGGTHPLGRYMFTDQSRVRSTGGLQSAVQLVDEMFLVDQKISDSFAATGAAFLDTLHKLLDPLPVEVDIAATPFAAVGGWGSGTNRGQIVDALATQGGYFSPWFANDGRMKFIRIIDPAAVVPALDFDTTNHVMADTIVETDDLLDAPNRFVVIGNGVDAASSAIVGVYDVPASAPYSITNRGFVVPDVRSMQVTSTAQAQAAARQIGIQAVVFSRTELSTPPDPRHDSYDVIRWQGVQWLEIGWSMQLVEGGDMKHVMRRVYS